MIFLLKKESTKLRIWSSESSEKLETLRDLEKNWPARTLRAPAIDLHVTVPESRARGYVCMKSYIISLCYITRRKQSF